MIKRLVLVVSVCLTALLITSCSDGGTESGVNKQATGGQSIVDWGKSHYDAYGKAEGRTLPANCTSSDTTTTVDTISSW